LQKKLPSSLNDMRLKAEKVSHTHMQKNAQVYELEKVCVLQRENERECVHVHLCVKGSKNQ